MGAVDFHTQATGRNVAEAYADAVSDALYEGGHDAYSGHIGTGSSGYLVVSKPSRVKAAEWAAMLHTAAHFQDTLNRPEVYPIPKRGTNDYRWWAQSRDAHKRVVGFYGPKALSILRSLDDKWGGRAIAIRLGKAEEAKVKEARVLKGTRKQVWYFTGMAPS